MNVIAVYPGRFHPFHKGHASSFNQLAQQFGLDNTFLAISAKQEMPKSPFSAGDRAKMAMALGIPKEHIIAVKNPYGVDEYAALAEKLGYDINDTAIVYGVSKKDMEGDPSLGIPPDPRFSFKPKKDGSPSYLQPLRTGKLSPMTQHGYVSSTDVAEFPVAGQTMRDASAIRSAYMKGNEQTRNRILTDLYGPKAAKLIKPVFDANLQLTENFYKKLLELKKKLTESRLNELAPGGEFGGGPSFFLTIARAWYYHDLSELSKLIRSSPGKSAMGHIMDEQLKVEKMLDKGIIAPDGIKRKYIITYNHNYDGVIIYSTDFYNHAENVENGGYIDDRTGKPFSEYDYMEFNDDQLKSGMLEGKPVDEDYLEEK
jgi:cytidyltransferase-like protein